MLQKEVPFLKSMGVVFKILFTLSLLFVSGFAQHYHKFDVAKSLDADRIISSIIDNTHGVVTDNTYGANIVKTEYKGEWELFSQDSGVSAMHAILLPSNKVVMFDATVWEISNITLPAGTPCRVLENDKQDCWSHSIFFDIETGERTPLKLESDSWCSSGALDVNGNLISTGGDKNGSWTVRYLDACPKGACNWREYQNTLKDGRWYATTVTLANGRFVIFGGREAFSYEFIPAEGLKNPKSTNFPFLLETKDPVENNLYPFVHLNTDGNLFIFANNRSVLLDIYRNKIIREYPILPGGARSYPATGMSALLPIVLTTVNQAVIPAEVLICGGSTHDAFYLAEKRAEYVMTLDDCNTIGITDKDPQWRTEKMPTGRVLSDMIVLPTGDILMVNGAKKGSAGWGDAKEPRLTPVLYKPNSLGKKFKELAHSNIPRMYHSSAVLLPDGKILVAGSNTNNGYVYGVEFPTELRVEKFSPPYLDPNLADLRPEIVVVGPTTKFTYGQILKVKIKLESQTAVKEDLKVSMYSPPFTTHGISMNQRLVFLALEKVKINAVAGTYDIVAHAPPSGNITPQGYYLLFVVYRGVPSKATWVQIR